MDWLWWMVAALGLGVVEMLSLNLVLVMLAGGALAGGLVALADGSPAAQGVVAVVVAVALLGALRPWLLRHLRARMPLEETNAAAQVGRTAVVVTEVSARGGRVKLVGEVWTARSADETSVFAVGTEVCVVRITGATAVVEALAPTS